MIKRVQTLYFQIQIRFMALFFGQLLFQRINQLDWYQATLRQWFDDTQGQGVQVLEVGCATGALSAYIGQSSQLTAVDYSPKMIAAAKLQHPKLRFLVANVLALPFDSDVFDTVIAASLLNIVIEPQRALSELARCCKPGGTVSVLVPLAGFSNADLKALQLRLTDGGFSAAAMAAWHALPPKMSVPELEGLFTSAGLRHIRSQYYLSNMVLVVSATA